MEGLINILVDVAKFSIDNIGCRSFSSLYPAVKRDLPRALGETDFNIVHVRLRGLTVVARPGKVEALGQYRHRRLLAGPDTVAASVVIAHDTSSRAKPITAQPSLADHRNIPSDTRLVVCV